MVKVVFKLFLATIVFMVLFMVVNAILPFSQDFKELGSSEDPMGLLYMLISSAWTCFAIYFIIKNTSYSGVKLFLNVLFVMFFIQYFMTQIETLFFGSAFTALSIMDIILIMFAGLLPLLGVVPLMVKLFSNKNVVFEKINLCIKDIIVKMGIIGIIYLCVYMIFGYFVAWQFEELRLFYTGSTEKLSFFGQMMNNIKTNPVIIPFQILRGILFGLAIIPIRNMINNSKNVFIISVCLIYLCTAIILIIPNVLFPDIVRIAHLIEMFSSMLLFGFIVGIILWNAKNKKTCT